MTVLLQQRHLRAMCWGRRHELLWSHLFPEAKPIPLRPPWDRWQLRYSLPTPAPLTEALFKRGWSVLAHNSLTFPTVRVIKLGIVQACRRLPVFITRDKILSWCLLVKDTIVCSCWPESCKPSVTSTKVSERPLGSDCSSFLWAGGKATQPTYSCKAQG